MDEKVALDVEILQRRMKLKNMKDELKSKLHMIKWLEYSINQEEIELESFERQLKEGQ